MSCPDLPISPDGPNGSDCPVFAEPWHGQVFALAVRLSEQGHFTWAEWAATFSEELARASAQGAPKDGSAYYDVWLTALEKMLLDRGLVTAGHLANLKQAWTDAYLSTPHGAPVHLNR